MSEAVASEAVAGFLGSLRYEVEVVGDCLGDWIPNGSLLVADRSEEIRPLKLVTIQFLDGDGPWSSWMRETGESSVCKIYLGKVEGAVLVGQLVPPIVGIIPETEIEAMHADCRCGRWHAGNNRTRQSGAGAYCPFRSF